MCVFVCVCVCVCMCVCVCVCVCVCSAASSLIRWYQQASATCTPGECVQGQRVGGGMRRVNAEKIPLESAWMLEADGAIIRY